jgi:Zn-dependent protease
VSQNPEEYPYQEDGARSQGGDYLHPDYYRSDAPQSPPAQPEEPFHPSVIPDPYAGSYEYSEESDQQFQNPYAQKYEYRGPQSIESYTVDAEAEQGEGAKSGTAAPEKKRKGLAGIGGSIAALGAWLLKLKGLVFLLKFGMAGFTALFSVAVYSLIFGWRFAVGLVASLFIHEMGHAIVMKLKGIPMGGLIFIPLLGAAVTMRQAPQNARDEAEVGIAGPIAGAIASSFCLFMAYGSLADRVWAPLAYFGFFINLFNLIPIVPFDGGRVLAAIDRRVWILGFLGLLAFQIWQWLNDNFSMWLLFFVIIAATQLWSRGFAPDTPASRAYYDVPIGTRIVMSLLYFGLAAVLFLGMSASHNLMPLVQ